MLKLDVAKEEKKVNNLGPSITEQKKSPGENVCVMEERVFSFKRKVQVVKKRAELKFSMCVANICIQSGGNSEQTVLSPPTVASPHLNMNHPSIEILSDDEIKDFVAMDV
jgi:hypothetical protein